MPFPARKYKIKLKIAMKTWDILKATYLIALLHISNENTAYLFEISTYTNTFKALIKRPQRALNLGDQEEFRRLRNRVNRERKSCRSKYYDRNIKHLKNCIPFQWWTEVNKLSGMSKGSGAKENIIKSLTRLNNGDAGVTTDADLVNLVNDGFLSPMKDFQPLT